MCRLVSFVAMISAISFCQCGSAYGQASRRPMRRYQSSVNEPNVSAYLNLARPGADPGFNYFTLVQPQIQQQRNMEINAARIQGLNADLQQSKAGAYGPIRGIRPTGRGATYRNYSHFYPSMASGGGASRRDYRSSVSTGASGFGVY